MRGHEKVRGILSRFEAVEWVYDGMGGKIIPWTKERGGTSDDPSVLAFVLTPGEKLQEKCPTQQAYSATSFAKWLRKQADAYDRAHPRTRVPFVRAAVEPAGARETAGGKCPDLEKARKDGRPVLLYFGRDARRDADRKAKREVKAARAFEKKHMGSKTAAKAAKGWTLLRFDLGDPDHAAFAKSRGVETAPAMLMLLPKADGPVDLTTALKTGSLAHQLKKHTPEPK